MSREEEGSNANRISDFHGGHGSSCLVGRPTTPAASVEPIPPVLRLWPLAQLAAPHLPGACRLDGSGDRPERRRLALALDRAGSRRHCVGRDRAAQCSSTSTRSSVASVSERATCSTGSPARAGYASARTTAVPPMTSFRSAHRREEGDRLDARARPRVWRRPDRHLRCRKLAGWSSRGAGGVHAPRPDAPARIRECGHSVAGIISLYGYYGDVAPGGPPTSRLPYTTTNAPPCFVAHGDRDTLVIVEDARGFVEQLRATSSNPVGLRRAARRATRVRPIPLPTLRHGRRCDRGIRSLHRLRWEPEADEIEVGRRVPHLRLVRAGKEGR